ncbi:MAG: hypothetical protein WCT03_00655 [Candidatus Obscuribacterales bacterium]|jgi:hypothetical protein
MPPSRRRDDIPKFMNRFTNALRPLFRITGWQPLLVLLIALAIRVVYNLVFFEHRICDIGDSSYYLTAGKALADLIRTSWSESHGADFLARLCQPTSVIPGSFQSFSSTNLSDRLLLDGPIFPSYLAGLFLLIGTQAGATANLALNAHSQFYAIANSVVDSFSCLLVCLFTTLAFGRRVGLLAGLGMALYAPSIINTQQCYGEPFAYFLLCCWTLLLVTLARSQLSSKMRLLNYFFLALFSGLLMLAKPAFVFLPWLGIGVYLAALVMDKAAVKQLATTNKRNLLLALLAFALGLTVALAPWLGFTRSVSGQTMLVVNRAPQYNLYIGNYLATDGWKTWPTQPNIPNTMADAKAFVMDEFRNSPLALIGLFLRKIARLTVGVWNEFQYPIGILTIVEQNIWQGVLLLLASLGLAAALNNEDRTAKSLALAFAAIILFHLIYACFEPVPRYAITAMPLVMAFAAQGMLTFYSACLQAKNGNERGLVFGLALWGLAGLNWLYRFASPVLPFAVTFITCSFEQIRMLVALFWSTYFVWLFIQLAQILSLSNGYAKLSRLAVVSLVASGGLSVLCTAAFFLQDPALSECSTLLEAGGPAFTGKLRFPLAELEQELPTPLPSKLPGQRASSIRQFDSWLLIDCETAAPPPVLNISVNGRSFSARTALMWNELLPSEKDVPVIIDLQSRAMSVDKRRFRQWWALPFSTEALRKNLESEVTLSVPAGSESVRIFYDLVNSSTNTDVLIPSLTKFSWTKGFLTFDHRDPRPYELRPASPSTLRESKSSYFAKLLPQLRLHLAIPQYLPEADTSKSGAGPNAPLGRGVGSILSHAAEHVVTGGDPRTFTLSGLVWDNGLRHSGQVELIFEVGKCKAKQLVEVGLTLNGMKDGKPISWRSPWQPACIEAGSAWRKYQYVNVLPSDFGQWQTVSCTVSMSPFVADKLYLHPKEAQRAKMTVRNLYVEIGSIAIPTDELKWALH